MFMDFIDLILSQIVGFLLWLIVFPLRLIIGVLDPVFAPITAAIDVDMFLDGFETLRPIFRDVNYFIPFGAALGIFGATLFAMLMMLVLRYAVFFSAENFASFGVGILHHLVVSMVDGVKKFLHNVVSVLMGG